MATLDHTVPGITGEAAACMTNETREGLVAVPAGSPRTGSLEASSLQVDSLQAGSLQVGSLPATDFYNDGSQPTVPYAIVDGGSHTIILQGRSQEELDAIAASLQQASVTPGMTWDPGSVSMETNEAHLPNHEMLLTQSGATGVVSSNGRAIEQCDESAARQAQPQDDLYNVPTIKDINYHVGFGENELIPSPQDGITVSGELPSGNQTDLVVHNHLAADAIQALMGYGGVADTAGFVPQPQYIDTLSTIDQQEAILQESGDGVIGKFVLFYCKRCVFHSTTVGDVMSHVNVNRSCLSDTPAPPETIERHLKETALQQLGRLYNCDIGGERITGGVLHSVGNTDSAAAEPSAVKEGGESVPGARYTCPRCQCADIQSAVELEYHVTCHREPGDDALMVCYICESACKTLGRATDSLEPFSDWQRLRSHLHQIHQIDFRLRCDRCDAKFGGHADFNKHRSSHWEKCQYSFCKFATHSEKDLEIHTRCHCTDDLGRFKCYKCGYRYQKDARSWPKMRQHLSLKHAHGDAGQHTCTACRKTFQGREPYRQHIRECGAAKVKGQGTAVVSDRDDDSGDMDRNADEVARSPIDSSSDADRLLAPPVGEEEGQCRERGCSLEADPAMEVSLCEDAARASCEQQTRETLCVKANTPDEVCDSGSGRERESAQDTPTDADPACIPIKVEAADDNDPHPGDTELSAAMLKTEEPHIEGTDVAPLTERNAADPEADVKPVKRRRGRPRKQPNPTVSLATAGDGATPKPCPLLSLCSVASVAHRALYSCPRHGVEFESDAELQTHYAEQHSRGAQKKRQFTDYVVLSDPVPGSPSGSTSKRKRSGLPGIGSGAGGSEATGVAEDGNGLNVMEVDKQEGEMVGEGIDVDMGRLEDEDEASAEDEENEEEGGSGRGERSGRCPHCYKQFATAQRLAAHCARQHSTDKLQPVPCHVCGRLFRNNCQRRNHVRQVHEGTKRKSKPGQRKIPRLNVCEQCGYTTPSGERLRNHQLAVHQGVLPYSCDRCSYRTSEKSDLRRHQQRHLGIKKYECEHCPYRTNARWILVNHCLKQHAVQLPKRSRDTLGCPWSKRWLVKRDRERRMQEYLSSIVTVGARDPDAMEGLLQQLQVDSGGDPQPPSGSAGNGTHDPGGDVTTEPQSTFLVTQEMLRQIDEDAGVGVGAGVGERVLYVDQSTGEIREVVVDSQGGEDHAAGVYIQRTIQQEGEDAALMLLTVDPVPAAE